MRARLIGIVLVLAAGPACADGADNDNVAGM